MSENDNVALVAMIIAIVALVIAGGQLLQQMFGTADGYRNCQSSIIGPWSRRTRLNWRWREFRYETKFTTPEIVLVESDMLEDHKYKVVVLGPKDSLPDYTLLNAVTPNYALPKELRETIGPERSEGKERTWARQEPKYLKRQNLWMSNLRHIQIRWKEYWSPFASINDEDQVSWLLFLRQMYLQQTKYWMPYTPTKEPLSSIPRHIGVSFLERSWDVMTPEVTRPLATCTLGNLIIIAHRLGMRWLDMRPSEGYMRAEGSGHSLTSTLVRGLGAVFAYSFENKRITLATWRHNGGFMAGDWTPGRDALIPTRQVDMMACGVIAGEGALGVPNLPLVGADEVESRELLRDALFRIGLDEDTSIIIGRSHEQEGIRSFPWECKVSYALNDWVGVVSCFLPILGCDIVQVVYPIRTTNVLSAFHFWESRETLLARLEDTVANCSSPSAIELGNVLRHLSDLHDTYPDDFLGRWNIALIQRSNNMQDRRSQRLALISKLREIHASTTQYFQKSGIFLPLVASHIAMSVNAWSKAHKQRRAGKLRDKHGTSDGLRRVWHEIAHQYVDLLEDVVTSTNESLRNAGKDDMEPYLIEEAWWMLVLRGISWYMSLWITVPRNSFPSHYHESQTRVYIT